MAYQVIPRTLIFIFYKDQVLLLKGAPDKKNFPGLLNGLGGHVERDESILDSARRELFEESGLLVPALDLCGILHADGDEQTGILIFIFKAVLETVPDPLVPSGEGALCWYPIRDVPQADVVPDIPAYFERICRWRPGVPPFYATVRRDSKNQLHIRVDSDEPGNAGNFSFS